MQDILNNQQAFADTPFYDDVITFGNTAIQSISISPQGYIQLNTAGGTFMADTALVPKPPRRSALIIEDKDGNQWVIQPNGSVVAAPHGGLPPKYNYSDDKLDATDSLRVDFTQKLLPSPQLFGFDARRKGNTYFKWAKNFEAIRLKGGLPYFVPYQSLGAATLTATNTQREEVVVNIKYLPKATEPAFSASNLSFKLGTTTVSGTLGTTPTTTGYTASFLFNLPAVPITGTSGDEPFLYAYYGTKKIGKISIAPFKRREEKVILVPVNGAAAPNAGALQTYLDSVYRQANVRFTVTEKTGFRFNLDTNNVAGLERAGSGINKYSAEMRMLRDKFAIDTTYDKKASYIFVVPAFEGGGLDGFMVRGRSMGFVASGANKRTYAHELGHGAFGLEHTFPEIGQSLSNNLMDYGDSTHLTHKQCKDIQKRKLVFNWLDSEEDGGLLSYILDNSDENSLYSTALIPKDEYYLCLTPSGKYFFVPNTADVYFGSKFNRIHHSALTGFKLADGTVYVASYNQAETFFYGYRQKTEGTNKGKIYRMSLAEKDNINNLARTQDLKAFLLVPSLVITPQLPNTPSSVGPRTLLPLRVFTFSLVGGMIFLRGDTREILDGSGTIPNKVDFARYLLPRPSVELPVYDAQMPNPSLDSEATITYLLNKLVTGTHNLSIPEEKLLYKLQIERYFFLSPITSSLQTPDELNLWNIENKIRNGQTITDAEWQAFATAICSIKNICRNWAVWKTLLKQAIDFDLIDENYFLDLVPKKANRTITTSELIKYRELYDYFFIIIPAIVIKQNNIIQTEIQKLKDFYPPLNPDDDGLKNIEFVFDYVKKTFAVGRPDLDSFSSGHEKLSYLLEDTPNEYARNKPNHPNLVGGHFYRDALGNIIVNEYSGHFRLNWTPQARQEIITFLHNNTNLQIIHKTFSQK